MGKTAAASAGAAVSRDAANSKHKSNKSKSASRKKAKKEQDANLAGIGAQFWQDNEAQQSSSSGGYPKKVILDE
ncbi:hypothetical protein NPX13_g944 [Xylaria arbuscula]|uniref:Uncharacterized protein n=1 Tax=Xylaria arbuscula TaxID=114810 RepID=A0A9W8TRP8_9PEZI|nr:hypothetical protein NPX13_g944 [Xylaria arbuscula]